jgi:hypothetical protein
MNESNESHCKIDECEENEEEEEKILASRTGDNDLPSKRQKISMNEDCP